PCSRAIATRFGACAAWARARAASRTYGRCRRSRSRDAARSAAATTCPAGPGASRRRAARRGGQARAAGGRRRLARASFTSSLEEQPPDAVPFRQQRVEIVRLGEPPRAPPEKLVSRAGHILVGVHEQVTPDLGRERAADGGLIVALQLVGVGQSRVLREVEILPSEALRQPVPEALRRAAEAWERHVVAVPRHHAHRLGVPVLTSPRRVAVLERGEATAVPTAADRIAPAARLPLRDQRDGGVRLYDRRPLERPCLH